MGKNKLSLWGNSPLCENTISNLKFLYEIFHQSFDINKYGFYKDFILVLKEIGKGTTDTSTISRYINKKMPKYIIEFWENPDNKKRIQEKILKSVNDHLEKRNKRLEFTNKLEFTNNLLNNLLDFLSKKEKTEIIKEYFKSYVDGLNNEEDFYYDIFLFCITNKIIDLRSPKVLELYEKEFFLIVQKYGVSGNSGKNIILNLARGGSRNPYILFEAGEIEYNNRRGNPERLEQAYFYYHKAQRLGYPLASWAIGYMIEHDSAEDINNRFIPENRQDRLKKAYEYYKIAADAGCSKAFNSIGNLIASKELAILEKENAKLYYEKSAELGNVFGMSNYASILEKELIEKKKTGTKKNISKEKEWISETGKEMIQFFEKSANLGYEVACLKTALYYGGYDIDEIADFREYDISFVDLDIDRANAFLFKCFKSGNNNISALAGYYIASYLYDQGNEKALTDAWQMLDYISKLKKSEELKQKVTILYNKFNEDEKCKTEMLNIFKNYNNRWAIY